MDPYVCFMAVPRVWYYGTVLLHRLWYLRCLAQDWAQKLHHFAKILGLSFDGSTRFVVNFQRKGFIDVVHLTSFSVV